MVAFERRKTRIAAKVSALVAKFGGCLQSIRRLFSNTIFFLSIP